MTGAVVRFDTAVVVQSNCICKGFCLLLCAGRPQSRLCSSITNPFSLKKFTLGTYSYRLPNRHRLQAHHFLSISLDCLSSYRFVEPLKGFSIWLSGFSKCHHHIYLSAGYLRSMGIVRHFNKPYLFKGVASCSKGSKLVRTTVTCGSSLVGRFDTAINSYSSAALSTTVPSSSEVYRSLSGS